MSVTTIPDKIYVTFKREGQGEDAVRLGFASPDTGDAPFEKRKHTQNRWAYDSTKLNADGKLVRLGTEYHFDEVAQKNIQRLTETVIADDLLPATFSNEPLPGFQISRSVRRYGWNGGNSVWRIADPRGFELEISSANFARVVDCSTLDKGVISDRCVWGRCGSENILLPESSDVFADAQKETVRRATVVKMGELTPGDRVDLISGTHWDSGPATFLGKYWIQEAAVITTEVSDGTTSWNSRATRAETIGWTYQTSQIARYIFELDDGTFAAGTSPKVSAIIKKATEPLDKAATSQRLCGANIAGAGYGRQWFVWHEKIDQKKISMKLALAKDQAKRREELKDANLSLRLGAVGFEGKLYTLGRLYHSNKLYNDQHQPVIVALQDLTTTPGHVMYEQNAQEVNDLFGGVTTFLRMLAYEIDDIDRMDIYDLILEYGGKHELVVPMITPYSFQTLKR